ncbi:MAG: hypothetical protein K2L70_04540 [Clostridia bacterium]|nr:hypothetical protein [Clostridia bacterium]
MKNKQKQENKGLERLEKAFRASSVIFHILLFIGGVVMVSFLIWLCVNIGVWVKLGL